MPIYRKQNTFTSGEISPRLFGRTDFDKYNNAVRTMLNCYSQPHGGCTKRSGTEYIATVKDSSKKVRLVPFEFSTTQTYILEFGDLYIRFYKDQGQIVSGTPVTVVTTYTEAELNDLSFTQSADTLFIAHADHKPAILTRTSHTSWNLSDITFTGGPYLAENLEVTTLTPSATTGSVTITASAVTGINGGSGFIASDIGRLVTITHGSTDGIARITAVADTTHCTATTETDFGATTAQAGWSLGAWGGTVSFPKYVTFYENRLIYAGTSREPQNIWMSKIGSYYDFLPGGEDDDPVNTTIVSNSINALSWMSTSKNSLIAGTTGGEWALEGDLNTGITPTSLRQLRESTHGSKSLDSLAIESQTLFIQRQGRNVREFKFVFESDSYQAPDLSVLAEHMTRDNTIEAWAYAEEPNSIVWMVRDDGTLLGMTYSRTQDVIGWHQHTTGASGEFESVASISGADRDEVWVVVKRTIDGNTVRYVELLGAEYSPNTDTDATNAVFLDSNLAYSGSATASFSGLDHLEGESVSVLADGKVHPPVTVASGAITLNYTASVVVAGLNYNADIYTLPVELDNQQGTSSGRTKRISRVVAKLHETIGIKVGKDADNLEYIPFNAGQVYGDATSLFSGDKVLDFVSGDALEAAVFLRQEQPLPMTVLSLSTEIEVNDR